MTSRASGRWWTVLAILLILTVVTAGTCYLFRSVTKETGSYEIVVKYRMGRVDTLSWDRTKDGRIDIKAWVKVTKIGAGRHFTYLRVEEDTNGDSVFDRRFTPGSGDRFVVEIDSDLDGRYDKTLQGEAARQLYPLPDGPIY